MFRFVQQWGILSKIVSNSTCPNAVCQALNAKLQAMKFVATILTIWLFAMLVYSIMTRTQCMQNSWCQLFSQPSFATLHIMSTNWLAGLSLATVPWLLSSALLSNSYMLLKLHPSTEWSVSVTVCWRSWKYSPPDLFALLNVTEGMLRTKWHITGQSEISVIILTNNDCFIHLVDVWRKQWHACRCYCPSPCDRAFCF